MNTESATNVLTRQWRIATCSKTVTPRNRMPETGASGSVGAPLEQSEGATRQPGPPYGLPPIYSVLNLSSLPLRAGEVTAICFRPLLARSELSRIKNKTVPRYATHFRMALVSFSGLFAGLKSSLPLRPPRPPREALFYRWRTPSNSSFELMHLETIPG